MNANQIAQIATALNVSPNQIKRFEEWKNVLFVVVQGKGARFVSKKVIKMDISHYDFACEALDLIDASGDFDCKLWTGKRGETRLYVKKTDKKKTDCGFLVFSGLTQSVECYLSRQSGTIRALFSDLSYSITKVEKEIAQPKEVDGDEWESRFANDNLQEVA
jgi:lambda repressor-like predicted transcriptional regulator